MENKDGLPEKEELGIDLMRGQVAAIVSRSVGRIVRGMYATSADREDLAQDIRLEILRRLPWFDANRGAWPAFATLVARRQEARLRKRLLGRLRPIGAGEQVVARTESTAAIDLRLDVASAKSQLSVELAKLSDLVQADFVATVARRLGIPRRTLRAKLAKLKQHLQRHKLSEYWPQTNAS